MRKRTDSGRYLLVPNWWYRRPMNAALYDAAQMLLGDPFMDLRP